MSSPAVKPTPSREPLELTGLQEVADFLVSLNDGYLSLDLTRQALRNHFSYVRDEGHADKILFQLRDRNVLRFIEVNDARWRWVRIDSLLETLEGIGSMVSLDEKRRKSTAALQASLDCPPEEAERVWEELEETDLIRFVSDSYGPASEKNCQWRWQKVPRKSE